MLIKKGGDNMPKFDGTGPTGMGPMTGRGFGPCGGCVPHGCGMGMGRRGGFGRRRGLGAFFGWCGPQTKKDQVKALSDYKKALEEELEDIKKELKEVDKS